MKLFGSIALAQILGDFVVYRTLQPVDQNLPGLKQLAPMVGLAAGRIPRKQEPDYAQVVAHMLGIACDQAGKPKPQHLITLGDTRLADVTAFRNLCQAAGWAGTAFICAEKQDQPAECQEAEAGVFLANRWQALGDFMVRLPQRGFTVDERTVLMVDIDKTAIGARGRNDHAIDQARIEGVRRTAAALFGSDYDEDTFLKAYFHLNQQRFHYFTADNQDYLVYICLAIAAGLVTLPAVTAELEQGTLNSFDQFIQRLNSQQNAVQGSALAAVHQSFYALYNAGDPTPFKQFRHNEFRATIEKMGSLVEPESAAEALQKEIVITNEVVQFAEFCRRQGATVFGISDKPDEAALPSCEDEQAGYLPLHRALTHCVGEAIL